MAARGETEAADGKARAWKLLAKGAGGLSRLLALVARSAKQRSAGPPPAVKWTRLEADEQQRRLDKVDHIVVLMLENRSFDHMLGYLSLEGRGDIEGLSPEMSNTYDEKDYPVFPLGEAGFGEGQDPCHDGDCVADQIADGQMSGFVQNYAETHPDDPEPGRVMGYYTGRELFAYDHLAREFCVCDRWFSSAPGATWPNRLFAVSGRADGSLDNAQPPLYDNDSFVRHLDDVGKSWRWYSFDPGTLRMIDGDYRLFREENFAPFERRSPFSYENFLADAAAGELPSVSWIDPNFVDFNVFFGPEGSNDDHPPSVITRGQELVLRIYDAVRRGPNWERTMLVITYDEHGGFFDHYSPPEAPTPDGDPRFARYGVRVPAIVVSPWVEEGGVSHQLFDHASIIKTILLRFARRQDNAIPDMGPRVTQANHLGSLLSAHTARTGPPIPVPGERIEQMAEWRTEAFASRALEELSGDPRPLEQLNELQRGIFEASRRLREEGLPPGQP